MSDSLILDWFRITEPSPGVFAIMEPLQIERVLSYLIVGEERALLIDSGTGAASMRAAVETITDLPVLLVNSHTHWDHVGSNDEFTDIAVHRVEAHELAYVYSPEQIATFFAEDQLVGPLPPGVTVESISIGASTPTQLLDGDESFDLGGRVIRAIHTPGHSPGLLSFFDDANAVLFTTDTAYLGHLYAYSDETDIDVYIQSLDTLARLAPSLKHVHPSHNTDLMPAELLPRMRDALIEVRDGKTPDDTDDVKAIYRYDGFGVYGPLPEGDC
ncbi:MAG: MBL fold metallo-hydrolase [Thermomicrobiales bacterium]|nr:MAG: MBL fold metallo-hydrolase [Thermomicrobiales bacterium]